MEETKHLQRELTHLFEDYKPQRISSQAFYALFFLRRYFLIYSLVLQPDNVRSNILIHIFTTMFMIAYIWTLTPYSTDYRNRQELFNEVTILISIYCLTGYTDFFNSDQDRFDEGRSCFKTEDSVAILYVNEQCPEDYLERIKLSQFTIGWIQLTVIGINIALNLLAVTFNTLRTVFFYLKYKYPSLCKKRVIKI